MAMSLMSNNAEDLDFEGGDSAKSDEFAGE